MIPLTAGKVFVAVGVRLLVVVFVFVGLSA